MSIILYFIARGEDLQYPYLPFKATEKYWYFATLDYICISITDQRQ